MHLVLVFQVQQIWTVRANASSFFIPFLSSSPSLRFVSSQLSGHPHTISEMHNLKHTQSSAGTWPFSLETILVTSLLFGAFVQVSQQYMAPQDIKQLLESLCGCLAMHVMETGEI